MINFIDSHQQGVNHLLHIVVVLLAQHLALVKVCKLKSDQLHHGPFQCFVLKTVDFRLHHLVRIVHWHVDLVLHVQGRLACDWRFRSLTQLFYDGIEITFVLLAKSEVD